MRAFLSSQRRHTYKLILESDMSTPDMQGGYEAKEAAELLLLENALKFFMD